MSAIGDGLMLKSSADADGMVWREFWRAEVVNTWCHQIAGLHEGTSFEGALEALEQFADRLVSTSNEEDRTGGSMSEEASKPDHDLLGIVATTIADVVGGRAGIALRGLAKVGGELRRRANEEIASASDKYGQEGAPIASVGVGAELVAVSGEPLDEVAMRFAMTIMGAWRTRGPDDDLESFLDECAIRVWANQKSLRRALEQDAYDPTAIRIICRDAGIDLARVTLTGSAEDQWFSIFEYVRTQNSRQILFLLFVASERFPDDQRILRWISTA